jgi:hypothetical protein
MPRKNKNVRGSKVRQKTAKRATPKTQKTTKRHTSRQTAFFDRQSRQDVRSASQVRERRQRKKQTTKKDKTKRIRPNNPMIKRRK